MTKKEYRSEKILVTFDAGRCIHAKECINGLPEVFSLDERPWIQPGNSDPETIAETVTRCPTGALQFTRKDGGEEEGTPEENVFTIAEDGPLYVRGDLKVEDYDGSTLLQDTRVAFCRCGDSRNKPFCDGGHASSGFRDPGEIEGTSTGAASRKEGEQGSELTVRLTPNGPLFLKGEFEIRDAKDKTAYRGSKAALCRCGLSEKKPFCDGSHGGAGWRDD